MPEEPMCSVWFISRDDRIIKGALPAKFVNEILSGDNRIDSKVVLKLAGGERIELLNILAEIRTCGCALN